MVSCTLVSYHSTLEELKQQHERLFISAVGMEIKIKLNCTNKMRKGREQCNAKKFFSSGKELNVVNIRKNKLASHVLTKPFSQQALGKRSGKTCILLSTLFFFSVYM